MRKLRWPMKGQDARTSLNLRDLPTLPRRLTMQSKNSCLAAAACLVACLVAAAAGQDLATPTDQLPAPRPLPSPSETLSALVEAEARPIDLAATLQLAGTFNPEILLARERVDEAMALRQLAAAQLLPSVNAGGNLDHHLGPLQQSNGKLIDVHRDAVYLGLGANAVGGGTVNIPGIVWDGNVSAVLFQSLARRQFVRQQSFASLAVRNQVLLRAASAYLELLRASGRRAVAQQLVANAKEVARLTANFAKTGQGRQADADRAATELEQRKSELVEAENQVLAASAALCQLLSLDPSVRLAPVDSQVVPAAIVPEPITLPELIAIALVQRPELAERRAAIRVAFLELREAKLLPFSPNLLVGYSAGTFGGGSNLIADNPVAPEPRFGNFGDREDLDVILFWSLRNLGVGNVALIRLGQSRLRQEELRQIDVLDRIRAEVATAQARAHARYAQIDIQERAVATSLKAFQQDYVRAFNKEALPIEVLDSLRLLGRSRQGLLDAIIDYNRAQFELYVAMGQPPAALLARPVPTKLLTPGKGPEVAPK
jgi:outer membrane protein TolC